MPIAKDVAIDVDLRTKAAFAGPVQVTIPAKAAFDIDTLFEVQRTVFERLGHPACYSAMDVRFTLEREFLFGPDLQLR